MSSNQYLYYICGDAHKFDSLIDCMFDEFNATFQRSHVLRIETTKMQHFLFSLHLVAISPQSIDDFFPSLQNESWPTDARWQNTKHFRTIRMSLIRWFVIENAYSP